MWWGVDSSGAMNDDALAAVQAWYRGARPQVWGRYLNGSYAVTASELAWARRHGIYVDLLVPDDNCSQCAGGGDLCGGDETSQQAVRDAGAAVAAAKQLKIPAGARIFKDLEQVAACHGEPTAAYVRSWYITVRQSPYLVGLYGNSTTPAYAFPRAYCQVLAGDPTFGKEVALDATEPEPELGKPRSASGPGNAPPYRPDVPPCAPAGSTVIWQYGESVDRDNYADIDQVNPRTAGLLAPDGGVTVGPR